MVHLNFIDSIVVSEYLILISILLMLINFLLSIFYLYIRHDALYNNSGTKFLANIIILTTEVAFIFASSVILTNENLAQQFCIPQIIFAALFTVMLTWGFIQMNGLSDRSMEVLETLVGVIEAGDENLDGHSLHVQNLSMLIYEHLSPFERIKINPVNLQYAALFLDIGKLGVPRSIIAKKGKLLPKERELIQRHPEICEAIFSKIPSFTTVTYWIKYHHERVDGNGYYKKKGNEIPLASRILAIADTYSAITMSRSYRASLPYENAISELRLVAGTQLDKELVDIFCNIPKGKVLDCMNDVRNRMKKYQAGEFRW